MKWSEEELLEALLHGSGIDAAWEIVKVEPMLTTIAKEAVFECSNSWHYMDEYGYYNGWFDFSVTVPVEKEKTLDMFVVAWDFEAKEIDEELEWQLDTVMEYIEYTVYYSIKDYLHANKYDVTTA